MNNTHRTIIATYLTLMLMIILFNAYYAFEDPALYLKFGVRIAMFLTAVLMWKKYREQKIIVLAFLCTVISDFFFLFVRAVDSNLVNRDLYGMVGFIAAYLFLVAAFQRNFRVGKAELLTAVPFIVIFGIVLRLLEQYTSGPLLLTAIVLGVVLCYTAVTMVSTLYRGYFEKKNSWMIALAGCILFLSDLVVAFSIFHPNFSGFILWKENVIWVTYMIGWILLLMITAEDKILANDQEEGEYYEGISRN